MKLIREQILAEPAGEKMDAWMAEYIMGYKWVHGLGEEAPFCALRPGNRVRPDMEIAPEDVHNLYADWYDGPRYSSNMAEAWMVVECMMKSGYRYVMRGNFRGNGIHWAAFDEQKWADSNPPWQSNPCESLSLAICRAALIAVLDV